MRTIVNTSVAPKAIDHGELERLAILHHKTITGNIRYGGNVDGIVVNYLRHETTDYDEAIRHMKYAESKRLYTEHVFVVIAKTYPKYAREAQRQLDKKMPNY